MTANPTLLQLLNDLGAAYDNLAKLRANEAELRKRPDGWQMANRTWRPIEVQLEEIERIRTSAIVLYGAAQERPE